MGDAIKRQLKMPAWHIPYLEKHRIYELFRELTRELIIQQPVDHVLFLKQLLDHAAKSRDVSRVILLGSPKINCLQIARRIAQFTEQAVITEDLILSCVNKKTRSHLRPSQVARSINQLVRSENTYATGWILVDCIKTANEARALLELGILPTHVMHLIPPFMPPLTELLYCHVHEGWPEYRRAIMGVRDAFKHCLMEVFLGQRNMKDIIGECSKLIQIRKGDIVPVKPRVLIVGPRGSGRKTQAKLLSQRLNLVHVDFEYLLCQAWISETELGKKLRSFKDEVCFQSNLLVDVINKKLLDDECLIRGWVLTGFPFTVVDFKYLDCLDTPPNRVVFLDCDLKVCKERLVQRKVNVYTGSVINIEDHPELTVGKRLGTHPKDRVSIINAEMNYYCEQYGPLRSYCGGTASVVNGDQPQRWVYECITAIIVRASPACPPRDPCTTDEPLFPSGVGEADSDTCTPVPSKLLNSYVTKL